MATAEELTARLETLRAARANGLLEVRTADGRTVRYKTDAEQAAAIADLERQVVAATSTPIHSIRIHSSKGLEA